MKLTAEAHEIPPGPISEEAGRRSGSILTSLIVTGMDSPDIIGCLADAMCRAQVMFSPDKETALANAAGTNTSMLNCIETNWDGRDQLLRNMEARVERIAPIAAVMRESGILKA